MSGILYRIHEQRSRMSPTHQKLADYVLKHADKLIWDSTESLAEKVGVSNATISRFCQTLGFSGFKQFRLVLSQDIAQQTTTSFSQPESAHFKDNIAENLLNQTMSALQDTQKVVSNYKLDKAAKLLHQAKRIMCVGIGASDLVAQDMLQKLLRIEKNAFHHPDLDLQKVTLRQYTPQDLLIVCSYSGEKSPMLALAKQANAQKVPVIAISRIGRTRLSKLATVTLEVAAFEHDFRSSALSSRIAQLYMVDVLFYTFGLHYQHEGMAKLQRTYQVVQDEEYR